MSKELKKISSASVESFDEGIYSKSFTTDRKRVSKGVLYCQIGDIREEYVVSYLTIIMIFGSIVLDIYLLVKYTSNQYYTDDIIQFVNQVFIVIGFNVFGLILHVSVVNRDLKVESFSLQGVVAVGLGLLLGLALLLFQSVINVLRTVKYSVFAADYFLFFLSVAVSEEMLWRFGIQPSIKLLLNFNFKRKKSVGSGQQIDEELKGLNNLVASTIAIVATASLFTLFHIFVYESGLELFIVFVLGVAFGAVFESTKRLDAPIFAHFLVNAIAGIGLVATYFGGF